MTDNMTPTAENNSTAPMINAAGYIFSPLNEHKQVHSKLKQLLTETSPYREMIRGTVLVSPEGVNMFLTGDKQTLVHDFIETQLTAIDTLFRKIDWKFMECEGHGFTATRVRLKKEVISIGESYKSLTGQEDWDKSDHLTSDEWRRMIEQEDVQLLDTRNVYEINVGKFKNAKWFDIDTFREFPDAVEDNMTQFDKEKPLLMYCTRGVRCKKAEPVFKRLGFKQVYQLNGGILKYMMDMEKDETEDLYEGECFVYDHRVSVAPHNLAKKSEWKMCKGCMNPVSPAEQLMETFVDGASCPNCPTNKTKRQVYAKKLGA